jgi:hypothetical protein
MLTSEPPPSPGLLFVVLLLQPPKMVRMEKPRTEVPRRRGRSMVA